MRRGILFLTIATLLFASHAPASGASASEPSHVASIVAITPPFAVEWLEAAVDFAFDTGCEGTCYGSRPYKLLVNGAPFPEGEHPEWALAGVRAAGFAWYERGGIQTGTAWLSQHHFGAATLHVQIALRGSASTWVVGPSSTIEILPRGSSDGDWTSDALEARLCGDATWAALVASVPDARCEGEDLIAAGHMTLAMPGVVARDHDSDGDGWPDHVYVRTTQVSPTDYYPVRAGPSEWHDFDVREGERAGAPLLGAATPSDVLCMPLALVTSAGYGVDADEDGIPARAAISTGDACHDRTAPALAGYTTRVGLRMQALNVDEDDAWHDGELRLPYKLLDLPFYAAFDADEDADGVPAGVDILSAHVVLASPEGWVHVSTYYTSRFWDVDSFDEVPVPYARLDADQDDVPDAAEPFICALLEDRTTRADGACSLDRRDFVPPPTYVSRFRAPSVHQDSDGDNVSDAAEALACTAKHRLLFGSFACASRDDLPVPQPG
ncbi:MAG TPA: hypothetical protein VFH78_07215 [Candidatus Thermoplasmatota archaeon]|nr:hypothetical protein [Candidatus Thermoplasmatota archaeon]